MLRPHGILYIKYCSTVQVLLCYLVNSKRGACVLKSLGQGYVDGGDAGPAVHHSGLHNVYACIGTICLIWGGGIPKCSHTYQLIACCIKVPPKYL